MFEKIIHSTRNGRAEKSAPDDIDEKRIELILPPEKINQLGYEHASKLCDILNIPTGQISSVNSDIREQDLEMGIRKDKFIAESITNKSGVLHQENLTRDPRHFLHNFSQNTELREQMNPKLVAIFDNEIAHQKWFLQNRKSIENDSHTKEHEKFPLEFSYVQLPGGIDVVMKGYNHTKSHQNLHHKFYAKTAAQGDYLLIEGFLNTPYGDSLDLYWTHDLGNYDELMRSAVEGGFHGKFGEVDARFDRPLLDPKGDGAQHLLFPDNFYEDYFHYLQQSFPSDAQDLQNWQELKKVSQQLASSNEGIYGHAQLEQIHGLQKADFPYRDKDLKLQDQMTSFEYGQVLFADALAAIKMHLMANEMNVGRLEKGVIVDVEGALHLDNKSFFLKNPVYAFYTILKSPHYLSMPFIKEGNMDSIRSSFTPDKSMMEKMLRQIWDLTLSDLDTKDDTSINTHIKKVEIDHFIQNQKLNFRSFREHEKNGTLIEILTSEQLEHYEQLQNHEQTPLKKYEIPGREEAFQEVLMQWRTYLET